MFVGRVSIDQVENPKGVRVQPGGAALYAAMAAKSLLKSVTLVSAVGKDYKFTDVFSLFDSKHIKTFNIPSSTFNIRYDQRGEAQYLKAAVGAGSKIGASFVPTKLLAANSIVHLSPMAPTKTVKIFEKIRKTSPKTKISINTWINYIRQSRRNRAILKDLALKADFFILNDTEAKALAQTDSISTALRLLKAKMLIVTLGQLGAIINGEDVGIQMIPALNVPLENVVDTTGAGDTVWSLLSCLQTNRGPDEVSHYSLHNLEHKMLWLGSQKTRKLTIQKTRRCNRVCHRIKRGGFAKEDTGLYPTMRKMLNPRCTLVGSLLL